jgi:hypothetical protein
VISREWIEQILLSRVRPRMDVVIKPIEINSNHFAYVVTVPQSSGGHQAPDGKYYKRFNFISVPMADYEIRDVMRRSTTPILTLDFPFPGGLPSIQIPFKPGDDGSGPIQIDVSLRNLSNVPAEFVVVRLHLDRRQNMWSPRDFSEFPLAELNEFPVAVIGKNIGLPKDFPVFKENPISLGFFEISTHPRMTLEGLMPILGYEIRTPGFAETKGAYMLIQGGRLRLPASGNWASLPGRTI